MILHLKTVGISRGRRKGVAKDDDFNRHKGDISGSRYEEAIRNLERELAEKGLSREEIKSLEAVIYGRADEILEDATARTGVVIAEGTPDVRFPPRRDADFLDDISRETKGNRFSKGREETDMEKSTVKEGDRIYDLTDVVEETPLRDDRGDFKVTRTPPVKERLAGDAREEILFSDEKKVYELSNLFDESQEGQIREEIRRKAAEIAERVAREVMPGIVERVIREEIEKLKKA
jgi:hypothetical protein